MSSLARRRRRSGATLVEVLLGMAVSAILLGALSSAMVISAKAVPDAASPVKATLDAALAIDQLADELLVATSVGTRTPTAIEFTVADRNNDGSEEIIRYEWSGTAGTPLRRRYNAGVWVNILDDVHDLSLTYATYADTSSPSTATESTEMLLAGYTGTNSTQNWSVQTNAWIGQYFVPSLPNDATSWKVTRVRVQARTRDGDDGISRVRLHDADAGGLPTGPVIAESSLVERELGKDYLWLNIDFFKAGNLTPGAGACFLIQWIKDADACDIRYEQSRASDEESALLTSINGGATWSAADTKSLLYEVYGTYSAPSVGATPPPTYLTGVRIRLRAGESASSEIETRVPVLNEPRI
jgi:type II secretory pathway pseudopilin PulG